MSIRLKIVLLVVIGLAVIFAVLWYMFFSQGQDQAVEEELSQPTSTTTQNLPPAIVDQIGTSFTIPDRTTATVSSVDRTKSTLTRMASSFTERFGSYSNQSNYTNFEDLHDFMTSDMKRWAENMVAELRARNRGNIGIYFGVTTKSLSSKITSFSEESGRAEVLVKTQRREATGSTSNARIYYQDMIVNFVNEDGVWKVDGAFWQ